jgi:hypothetical protein
MWDMWDGESEEDSGDFDFDEYEPSSSPGSESGSIFDF